MLIHFEYFVILGVVEYAKFNETWKAVAKEFGCEERVQTVFDLFASLSGKDDTSVIGKEDLDALMDLLAGVGKRQIFANLWIHAEIPKKGYVVFRYLSDEASFVKDLEIL